MSRWIRAKYNEQCKENAHFTKKSVLINSGKGQEGYWLGILKEKCPEGLGKTSENLKNNQDLVPRDFLDDEDAFLPKGAATLKYLGSDEHSDSFAKTPRRLSARNADVKQDVLSVVPGEQENNNGLLEYGFKTPVLPKHNASISHITATPCLFSPELLSQAAQDIISKDHELNATPCKSETMSRLLLAQASLSTPQPQFASVHSSQENVQEKSPDILALMVADNNRPRSSLALLSAGSSDDEIDGWSDSMATPPVQWSQSQEGPKEDVEEQKKSNERVARTLFEGQTNQDMSSEMSGFSAIESGDDQNDTLSKTLQNEDEKPNKPDNVVELGRIFDQKTLKDSSLLKMIDKMENSPLCLSQVSDFASSASLPTEITESSRKRSNCSCKDNECNCCIDKKEIPVLEKKVEEDVDWSEDFQSFSSLLSQPTSLNMLPPANNTTSPIAYSQEVQTFMDLVQSTPKTSGNMVGKKKSTIRAVKCDKNYTLRDSQTFLSRSVLLDEEYARPSACGNGSKAARSSLVLEHDSTLCNELSTPVLHIPSASSSPLRGAEVQGVASETHSGAANNSMSFEMPKTPAINESSLTPSSFPKGTNAQVWVSKPHLGCEANDSLDIPLASRLPSSLFSADGSKPHCGEEAQDVSFGSISVSLEQAMVEEAEKVKTMESASDKNKGEQLSQADVDGNASKVKELNPGKEQQVTTETNPEREKKSPTTLLGVKRSSRSKRFSYPATRKRIAPKNTMECKVKKNEVDATGCNLSKRRVEKAENGRSDIMVRNANEREKETRSMEEVENGSEHQETSDLNSSFANQQDIHRPGNKTEGEGGIGNESGFQTSCNKSKQTSVASNKKPSEIIDLKNTSTENLKQNLQNTYTGSEDYFGGDMTDNTLLSIQEDFKTPQKVTSTEMELYDMDALSQFPVELLSPIQSYPCGYFMKLAGCKEFGRMESNAKVSAAMTAGVKGVRISEKAKKAKAVFEMDNRETNENTEACKISKFKTAGGKYLSIPEEAMKKAEEIFEMENTDNDGKVGSTKLSKILGFKTEGWKDISISKKVTKKAKSMVNVESRKGKGRVDSAKTTMSGFKTAGENGAMISEQAKKKAKEMLKTRKIETDRNIKASMMSGKDVSISEEAIKKAKAMFEVENDGKSGNTKPPMMSGFKTAGGKDVSISEEAIKKAKAMFENENRETGEKLDVYDLVSEKNKKDAKIESVSKERVVHFSSGKIQEGELSGTCTASVKKGNDSQFDQEVPLFKVLTPSKRSTNSVPYKTTITTTSSSPTSSRCTSIVYSTPIQVVDENLSREILESSAALIADDSFTNFSECNEIHCHNERSLVPSVSSKKTRSSDLCRSEPQLSKRETLMAKARRRSASFLSDGDRTNPPLQTRSIILPMRSSPSAILYDRRSKMFSPPLKPLVVSPNMSSFTPAKREAKRLFTNPTTTSPTKPFPLAAEIRSTFNHGPPATAHTGIPRRQFTTPYKSTSPLSNPTQPSHKEEGNGSPERKRPRILGSANNRRSGTKPDKLGRESVKPKMGYLFKLQQNSTRVNMKKYVDDTLPGRYTEQELRDLCVMDDVMTVTSHNAQSYRFLAWRFFSKETRELNQGIRTEDGGLLFIGEDGRIGVEEIERALSTTPGVDVKLIPHGWIANHYRWIVWKLAAMETAFPCHFAGRCLTPDWVLCQLKYRYDREVDRSHRSALKKILERDDLSSRTIVLCVSSLTAKTQDTDVKRSSGAAAVHEVSTVIELTDGWYSVNAVLDAPLTNLVTKGSIFEGLKLCINGAELVGSDQAVSPLEAPSSLMLRISANSTRRARWNSRLGFHSYSHPYSLPLSSLYPTGGAIGCVDVVVLRQYPVEYMEKLSDGTTVFRNSRAEEREAKRFARDLDRAREAVFTKVQREFEEEINKSDVRSSKKARSFSPKDISKLHNPREIYDAYSSASDPSFFEECLDKNQKKYLEDYRRTSHDNRRAELENMFQRAWDENDQSISKRKVVPMLKVRLVNYSKSNHDRTEAILSIWRPNEDVVQLLVEGSRLRIYHLMASGSRYRQGFPSLQFSTTRSTRYKNMSIDHDITDHLYNQRKTTPLDKLQTNPPALYSEVDLVGVIVSVTSHNSSSLQTVYISDEDHSLVSIKFWGGLKTYALDDLVKLRSLVACTNLVVRSSEHASCPTLAFNELSTLALKPKEPHLRTALDYLNSSVQDMDRFMDISQRSLDKIRRPDGTLNMTKSRVSDRDSPVEENTTTKSIKTERDISPKQLDSSAGCAQPITRDKDLPTPVSRPLRGQCKRKLLESIPEPPSTPSINVSVSDSVRRDFKRPRRLTTGILQ